MTYIRELIEAACAEFVYGPLSDPDQLHTCTRTTEFITMDMYAYAGAVQQAQEEYRS